MNDKISISFIREKPDLLEAVVDLADRNKSTLGFFPKRAFLTPASKNQILIAQVENEFAGYLLFRVLKRVPKASVTHLCVDKEFRDHGIGSALVDTLKDHTRSLWGISLNCRADYEDASRFWQSRGFVAVDEKKGRSKDGSTLIHWLFTQEHRNLVEEAWLKTAEDKLVVAVDYNVFLDLELGRNDEPEALGADWLTEHIQICPTVESLNELNRGPDGVRKERRKALKRYRTLQGEISGENSRTEEIRELVFGSRRNDQIDSDARQLAHAATGGAQFFLTRDEDILQESPALGDLLGLQVLHPREFLAYFDEIVGLPTESLTRLRGSAKLTTERFTEGLQTIADSFLRTDRGEKRKEFLQRLRGSQDPSFDGTSLIAARSEGTPVGVAATATSGQVLHVRALRVVDQTFAVRTLAGGMVREILNQAINESCNFVQVQDPHLSDHVEPILHQNGLRLLQDGKTWGKLTLTGVREVSRVHDQVRKTIEALKISTLYEQSELEAELGPLLCQRGSLSADRILLLEKLLGQLRLTGSECPTYVIPIRPAWAMQLFDHRLASTDLFGCDEQLAFSDENVYFRAALPPLKLCPARILWYVSRTEHRPGTGQIRAVSSMESVEVGPATTLYRRYQKFGVYKWCNILELAGGNPDASIMAIRFSNTHQLTETVPFEQANQILEKLGARKNQFQCPVRVADKFLEEVLMYAPT